MEHKFTQALSQLNAKQRQAVEAINGPVLVIAGPGTGKTQLLSMRVANILKSTDTAPNNILCLTFTNKAAVNMKTRIISLTGAAGTKVVASTFHSFAAEIMNLYPDAFWNAARLSVAPDSVQLDIIESIVSKLPLDNPLALKFAGQYTLLSDIKQAIKLAKDAGLTPDKLRAIINANLAYIDAIENQTVEVLSQRLSTKSLSSFREQVSQLPKQQIDQYIYPLTSLSTVMLESLDQAIEKDEQTGKCSNASKWKSRWVQTVAGQRGMIKERERNNWWLKLADVYESYRGALHKRGFYDYADMLVEVIAQLEQRPQMLADVQERFSYVLIDEFQDTTPAQLRLAHLVADHHSAEGKPNLMAVGDDDQSIFKFNGAELNNMLGFRRAYQSVETIILTENYRSSQAILDTAKRIVEQADSRLVNTDSSLDKELVAKNPPKQPGEIVALSYPSRELQLSEIARDIAKNYSPQQEIAVLARGHDSLVKMAALLQSLRVPVRYEQASNILDHEIVNQVYLLARLLLGIQAGDKEHINALIHQIIRWPAWGIEPKQLWELALNNYPNKDWLQSLLAANSLDLKAIGSWFIWLAAEADSQPLAITVEQIIGLRPSQSYLSPVREYFISANQADTNKYFHGLSAVQLLRSLVKEFSAEKQPHLRDLVRFMEINKENEIVVADESPFITGQHAVQLLSVHKAKGLEFDHVYIVDAIQDNWQPRKGGRKPPANLPLQPMGDDSDDYVRLMYVAATRAKASLTISAYYQDHSGKDVAVSSIVQAAFEVDTKVETDRSKLITVLEESLRWPQLSGGDEKQMLKARLETYNLSVTHLLDFLDVTKGGPQYFKERDLLYLRDLKTPSLSYGSAMHAALDTAQKLTNQKKFHVAAVIEVFDHSLAEEYLDEEEFSRYQQQGHKIITHLFEKLDYKMPVGSLSEQRLRDVSLGAARLGGMLDRVDKQGGKYTIIDYKTGKPLAGFGAKDIRAYKHKMQLIFYALMLGQQNNINPTSIEGQMVYVEAETQRDLKKAYTATAQEVERVQKLIEAVWQKIVNLELPDTSKYSQDLDGILAFENDLLIS
jgi:DNA helicase-2/ATP-dependent DNA helicase PcrA